MALALVIGSCGRVQLDVFPDLVPMRSQLDVVLPTSRRSSRAPNITLTQLRLQTKKKPANVNRGNNPLEGVLREFNPGRLGPKPRIMPLDQAATGSLTNWDLT